MSASYTPAAEKKLMFKLYWPVLIEQSLTILIGMVSTMMVSNVGAHAVSGVNLVDTVNMMIFGFFNALAAGATVHTAQKVGAGKVSQAGEAAAQSILLCFLTAAALGALTITFAKGILSTLYGSADAAVLNAGYTYFIFSGMSYPLLGVYSASAGIMRASGNSRTPMAISLISNIINISIAWILIYKSNMGVLGVSIAMLTARSSSGILSYLAVRRSHHGVVLPKFSLRLQMSVLKPILKIGIPSGIDSVFFQGARIVMTVLMAGMGTNALQANAIGNSLGGFLCLPGNAFQIVSVTMVGQAYGSRLYASAKRLMLNMCKYTSIALLALFIVFYLLLGKIVTLYGATQDTMTLIRQLLVSYGILLPLVWAYSFVLPQGLRAVGDAKFTMYISVSSLICLRVFGSWFFGIYLNLGVLGVWMGMYADWFGRAIGFLLRTLTNKWNGGEKPIDYSEFSYEGDNA